MEVIGYILTFLLLAIVMIMSGALLYLLWNVGLCSMWAALPHVPFWCTFIVGLFITSPLTIKITRD